MLKEFKLQHDIYYDKRKVASKVYKTYMWLLETWAMPEWCAHVKMSTTGKKLAQYRSKWFRNKPVTFYFIFL